MSGASNRIRVAESELREMIAEAMREPPGACAGCLPAELSPVKPVAGGTNWQLLSQVRDCPPGCMERLLEVCGELARHYDVAWP